MNEELMKALEELKREIGKVPGALQRIDAIEKQAAKAAEAATTLDELRRAHDAAKKQLDQLGTEYDELKREFDKAIKDGRIAAQQREGVNHREQAVRIMGAICMDILSRRTGRAVPEAFASDMELMRGFLARATTEAGATPGSYAVPTMLSSDVQDALEEVGTLLPMTTYLTDLPGNVDWLVTTGRPTLQPSRATVDTAMTASDPNFSNVQLRPEEAYCYFGVDNRLFGMSPIALGQIFLRLLQEGVIGGMENWLVNADGTSTYNSITGILSEGTYEVALASGKTGFADLTKQDLTKAKQKLLKRGRMSGRWIMSLEVLGIIEDLDRNGKAPLITYDQQGNARVLMMPVEIEETFPTLDDSAADTGFISAGDLRAYVVGLNRGMRIDTSVHDRFSKDQTTFRGIINMDIQRVPAWLNLTLKTAAS